MHCILSLSLATHFILLHLAVRLIILLSCHVSWLIYHLVMLVISVNMCLLFAYADWRRWELLLHSIHCIDHSPVMFLGIWWGSQRWRWRWGGWRGDLSPPVPIGSDNLCLQNAWDWASKGLMKPRRPLLRCFGACLSCRFRSYLHNFSLWVEKQLVALLYKISVLGLQIICAVPVLSVAESIDSLYCKHHSYSYMYLCTVQVEPFTAQLWWRARSIK